MDFEDFEPLVLRFAPDEAFAIGATGVRIDDPDAITEAEVGYVAMMFPVDEFIDFVVPRIEWPAPADTPGVRPGLHRGRAGQALYRLDRRGDGVRPRRLPRRPPRAAVPVTP